VSGVSTSAVYATKRMLLETSQVLVHLRGAWMVTVIQNLNFFLLPSLKLTSV